ncbi:anion permease [Breoghania sp.]|uniref:inorganic phosphate transporter n=1 Tax=Breoghania sp. TaxID=2065378 RepID=UPI0026032836|nr:anion permease [Breoghania sp.]MDJ0931402.1 inorganic phosphate transporter [Breoghania sp.]
MTLERAGRSLSARLAAPGLTLVFLVLAGLYAGLTMGISSSTLFIVVAAVLGGYMALTIGANDVANNVGPAVGARALTLIGALGIAATFETVGALLAGGDVVATISKGIIDPALIADNNTFIWAMMAALLSSALWVHVATWIGAPVSTTHSVVGGVMGAGIAAAGFSAVDWSIMGAITASWVISPLLSGVIAAAFLALIKINIVYQDDKIAAARRWVPLLMAFMAATFACYLSVKGLKKVWHPNAWEIAILGVAVFALTFVATKPWVYYQSQGMENRNQSLRKLFHLPLICSAALLSFAHGANDVANAVGPLAAIVHTVEFGDISSAVNIPVWIMLIGAAGISLGLFLYGPRLIRMVGQQITKMNPMRAYCVALSAAVTVIFASAFGLPVSSTHIAVGAVFGVGFFREYYTAHSKRRREHMRRQRKGGADRWDESLAPPEELQRRKLVRRAHFTTIIAAWVITVPVAAVMSAGIYGLTTLFH